MTQDSIEEGEKRMRLPEWMRTWWARTVAIVLALSAVLGGLDSMFNLFDRAPTNAGVVPISTPGPESSSEPGPFNNGGYGPERDTFTMETAAPYAVLNSITDHPDVGDERNFLRLRVDDPRSKYQDFAGANPGDEILVSIFVSNDASNLLASSAATIHGLTCQLVLPASGHEIAISALLSGKNVMTVWNGARVVSNATGSIGIEVVPGSATFKTVDGEFVLPDSFAQGEPTLLGQSALDGELPVGMNAAGMQQGQGYIVFRIRVIEG